MTYALTVVAGSGGVDTGAIIQLLLAVFGASGVLGAVVALFKLKPDANSAAVTQAQGAMTTMQELNEDLKSERESLRAEVRALQDELRAVKDECHMWRRRALDAEDHHGT